MKLLNLKHDFKIIALSVFLGTLYGCGSETESKITSHPTEVDMAIETAINNTIVLSVDDFSENIEILNIEIDEFCTGAANTSKLTELQDAWSDSLISWYQLLPFNIGPMSFADASTNQSSNLDFIDFYRNATVVNQTSFLSSTNANLNTLIASSNPITETSLNNSSPQMIGLFTLETAIFDNLAGNSTSSTDIVTDFNTESEKCDVIQAIGYELNRRAMSIQNQWTLDYRNKGVSYQTLFTKNLLEEYFTSLSDGEDASGTPASEATTVSIQEFLDFIGNANIINELNRYNSDTIWLALTQAIDTIEKLLDQRENTTLTLYAVMESNGYEQDVQVIKANFNYIKEKISEKNIIDFEAAAKTLDGNFKTSVINGLNINKGLTFADGDS